MPLEIICPDTFVDERSYAIGVIFEEWFKTRWVIKWENRQNVIIRNPGQFGEISMPDVFFSRAKNNWKDERSQPSCEINVLWESECQHNREGNKGLPILFGGPDSKIKKTGKCIEFPIDVIGSCFYMLSGYDEVVNKKRDKHNRFAGAYSISYKKGFLERPIVDEYVELLGSHIADLWPETSLDKRIGKVVATCDVDKPYDPYIRSLPLLARGVLHSLYSRKKISNILNLFNNYLESKKGNYHLDSNNTFMWYMDQCERQNLVAEFYFIPENSAGKIDGWYSINEKRILSLLSNIYRRGHEIGTHGSYNSYNCPKQIKLEKKRLSEVLRSIDIKIDIIGNRQHYLRWDAAETPGYLYDAGYKYDSTGSYPDMPGFRYGTAKPFSMWSWSRNTKLELKQRPLICMESSVLAARYLNMGYTPEALQKMRLLKSRAINNGGDFVLLWHNSHLSFEKDREFFVDLIS